MHSACVKCIILAAGRNGMILCREPLQSTNILNCHTQRKYGWICCLENDHTVLSPMYGENGTGTDCRSNIVTHVVICEQKRQREKPKCPPQTVQHWFVHSTLQFYISHFDCPCLLHLLFFIFCFSSSSLYAAKLPTYLFSFVWNCFFFFASISFIFNWWTFRRMYSAYQPFICGTFIHCYSPWLSHWKEERVWNFVR